MDFPTRGKRQGVARTDATQSGPGLLVSRNETAFSRCVCLATILSPPRAAASAWRSRIGLSIWSFG